MNNEIKEMAEAIFCAGVALDGSDFASKSDHFERLAKILYQEAGYRKQSDTIKEFKKKLLKGLENLHAGYKTESQSPNDIQPYNVFMLIKGWVNELAAEYGVEVE